MKKKILLTGMPRSGKTTLLKKITGKFPNKTGFITEEFRKNGERVGFKIVTSTNKEVTLASTEFNTEFKVSRYSVNINNLEQILPTIENFENTDILYIDEIGQMQLFSEKFKEFTNKYLNADNLFLGTISKIYSDAYTKEILKRDDIELLEVTPENRDEIYNKLLSLIAPFI